MMGALLALSVFGAAAPAPAPTVAPSVQESVIIAPVGRPSQRVIFDEVSIEAGGQRVSGWTSVRITRGIEQIAGQFQITLTERFPKVINALTALPGDACAVYLGEDLVITGYIDTYTPAFTIGQHSITMTGRSKTGDLVDSSAEWAKLQLAGVSVTDLARKLALPYGIDVTTDAPPGRIIPQFNLNIGETVHSIIDRWCRYAQRLAVDDQFGNLLITLPGSTRAAGGVGEGANVQAASVSISAHERYQTYRCFRSGTFEYAGTGVGGNGSGASGGGNFVAEETDDAVLRPRSFFFVAENVFEGPKIAAERARWEKNRRIGRSVVIRVTVDTWRDADGDLWRPNTLVSVSLPSLKIDRVEWLIAEVTFGRDPDSGTTCELVVMNPDAFLPQPIPLYQPFVDGSRLGWDESGLPLGGR